MKRQNKKLLTLMLAGALCAATIGSVATLNPVEATAAATTYNLTSIFNGSESGLVSAEKVTEDATAQTAKFSFKNEATIEFNRDLAWKWFEGQGQAKYLNFDFAFANDEFADLSFVFEIAPAQAVEGDKAINTLKFIKGENGWKVATFAGEEEPETLTSVALKEATEYRVTFMEKDDAEYGELTVLINGEEVGVFTNVGANFADSGSVDTFVMKGTAKEGATVDPAIYFMQLNGQSFDNITGETNKQVADDAAPVLVVNQDVSGFLLGTAFSLEYEKIDVLKASSLTETKEYYQWKPTDTEIKMSSLTTSTYFMDTVYTEGEGEAATTKSVYSVYGKEFINIRFTLGDGSDVEKETYDLSWYATGTESKEVGAEVREYIILDRNEEGPQYKHITANEVTKKNDVDAKLEESVKAYEAKLAANAEDVFAGSNAEMQLPALDWFLGDNNGYNNLLFTISYRTPSSTSPSNSSNKKYNALEIPTTSEGDYEFKVFATDSAGNSMQYYLNEELVGVTTSNVWEIEEIPSFKFKVANKGIQTADGEDSDTLDNKILGDSYTMSEVKIVGASNLKSSYQLFKFSDEIWGLSADVAKKISEIKFVELNAKADELASGTAHEDTDYMAVYKQAFLTLLAEKLNKTYADVENCLDQIEVYNSDITEDDKEAWEASDNKYNWSETSRRFTIPEEKDCEGLYLILADYWDEDLAVVDRVPAYQLIEVSEEKDTIKGVSEWLENNLVSVILFSISGVLLIAIIVLLFVKPSDETLADVDKKMKK
ncbi:MAG: hypothetical protein IJW96_02815 [Clostridia bacterium]|nr:hypothetical protein [Clostridia bacterium]